MERAHGRRSLDVIRDLVPAGELNTEASWFENLEVEDTEGVVALPGATALTMALPKDRWAVVTSCGLRLARARLAAAGLDDPPILIGSEDVSAGKPDPHGYRLGLAALGVRGSRTVVFEDAPSGLEAGRRAGARTVGVATTFPAGELSADWIVADLSSVTLDGTEAITIQLSLCVDDPRR